MARVLPPVRVGSPGRAAVCALLALVVVLGVTTRVAEFHVTRLTHYIRGSGDLAPSYTTSGDDTTHTRNVTSLAAVANVTRGAHHQVAGTPPPYRWPPGGEEPAAPCVNVETSVTDHHYSRFHRYPDAGVHVRFIVLTYDRPASLEKVLRSLSGVHLDGHRGAVEVWVDRSEEGRVSNRTLEVARGFCWDRGPVHVHVRASHAGIYGQWINTWAGATVPAGRDVTPTAARAEEGLAIILEDDTDVSAFAYRWVRAAHARYGGLRDVIGYSLQNENVKHAAGRRTAREMGKRDKGAVYGFRVPGSWGFAPHPARWAEFQAWYAARRGRASFRPHVLAAPLHTRWYMNFEKRGRADTMWTMWLIRYCWERKLYSVYYNFPGVQGNAASLVANRKEVGLHYAVRGTAPRLMRTWWPAAVDFPATLKVYDYDGKLYKTVHGG